MGHRSLHYFIPSYWTVLREFRNGPQLVWAHHYCRAVDLAIFRDGQRIVNVGHRSGFVETLIEIWGLEEYTRNGFYDPADGDVVLDFGANIGLFSIWIARRAPTATVLAFEPFPENYSALRANLTGWPHDIRVHNVAVGGTAGFGQMLDAGERSLDHRLVTAGEKAGHRVEVITLETAVELTSAPMVDLLKIDIEGSEGDVLASTDERILRRIRRVALEYHDNIRPGTLQLVRDVLSATHRIVDVHGESYGILHAELTRAAS